MIPYNITKEHIEKAIEEIDREGVRKGRHSSTYDLIHDGKSYPPKLIISISNRFANGAELDSANFAGGKDTAAFQLLEKAGYKIIEKRDSYHYKIIKEYIGGLRATRVKAANSIINIIEHERFEENIQKIDQYFFETKLRDISASNYKDVITFLLNKHKIQSGNYNDFNIWSASKTHLQKTNPSLIKRHEELNNLLGFPDNGNGLYKSFLGQKNLIQFITNKFSNNRKSFYNSLRKKMEDAGFKFEKEQVPQRQKRKEKELKFIHPTLIAKLNENNLKVNAKKFYLKPLSDEPDCEIGLVTGKSSPLLTDDFFIKPNTIDTYNNNPAWSNNEGDCALDDFLKSINNYLNISKNKMSFPLNTILYGPPGTGKTYNTILRAAQIIENRTIDSYTEALNIFKNNLHDQIEFITFHQNYSYEDFIQGLRPETDNKSSLVFDKKDGVFKKIADKALENLKLVQKAPDELSNEAKFNKALEYLSDKILESEDNFKINDSAYIFEVEEDAFRYTGEKWTNHANGLRMKFSDLKEFYRNNVKSRKDIKKLSTISGLANQHATYYYLVYAEIIKHLPEKAEELQKVTRKNFVIIIDEINRANISRVFGELITLIEPDKRSHGSIPLEARLPSGDPFIVPSNLFIIGTMNTADKSIALLDIALRRRFEFESMYPKYEIEGQEIFDVEILEKINKQIIKSKGHDFQIGHAYFMGDNKDLLQRMNKKVIPLLLEYYMNDEKEVKGILNSAGLIIEENSWPLKISGKNG